MESLNLTVGWGATQPGPYEAEPTALLTIQERWERALSPEQLGPAVRARLLYRRDVLELYLNDYLYPVHAFAGTTGRIGVTNATSVTEIKRWRFSEPEVGPAGEVTSVMI